MTSPDSLDRTGKVVALGVFVALVVDGMDLQMLSLALPSLSKELAISSVMAGALSTYTLLGMGIGGILAGWLSDRIGRVAVTWWAVLMFTLCTGLIGFSDCLLADRRACGSSRASALAAVYSIGTLLAAEYVPTRIRTTVLGVLQAGWSVGYVIAALLSSYLLPRFGWRPLFFCAILPGILSPGPAAGPARSTQLAAARAAAREAVRRRNGRFAVIWATSAAFRSSSCGSVTSIALQFGYYGANYVAAELSGEGSGRQPAEHGLVRRRHLRDDGGRQGASPVISPTSSGGRRCGSCRAC